MFFDSKKHILKYVIWPATSLLIAVYISVMWGATFGLLAVAIGLSCLLVIISSLRYSRKAKLLHRKLPIVRKQDMKLTSSFLGISHANNVFALVQLQEALDNHDTFVSELRVELCNAFGNPNKCSVSTLQNKRLAITIESLSFAIADSISARIEACLSTALGMGNEFSVGVCQYKVDSNQLLVYQLAESALAVAVANAWHRVHILPCSDTSKELLEMTSVEVAELLAQHRYLLLFQPVFSCRGEAILHHEVLLRLRHKKLGLLNAKQFLMHATEDEECKRLDLCVAKQLVQTLRFEKSIEQIHVNLTLASLLDKTHLMLVCKELTKLQPVCRVVIEVSEVDFISARESLLELLEDLKQSGFILFLDQVFSNELAPSDLRLFSGIKLDTSLVKEIDSCIKAEESLRQIANMAGRCKVCVYATGVETQSQLSVLNQYGIVGAQGYFFCQPLSEMSSFCHV